MLPREIDCGQCDARQICNWLALREPESCLLAYSDRERKRIVQDFGRDMWWNNYDPGPGFEKRDLSNREAFRWVVNDEFPHAAVREIRIPEPDISHPLLPDGQYDIRPVSRTGRTGTRVEPESSGSDAGRFIRTALIAGTFIGCSGLGYFAAKMHLSQVELFRAWVTRAQAAEVLSVSNADVWTADPSINVPEVWPVGETSYTVWDRQHPQQYDQNGNPIPQVDANGNPLVRVPDIFYEQRTPGLSPIFYDFPLGVRWHRAIVLWGRRYGLDPDFIAALNLVEACGDEDAHRYDGGADQGYWQVNEWWNTRRPGINWFNPFQTAPFAAGELLKPTIDHYANDRTRGIRAAAGGYNGGPSGRAYGAGEISYQELVSKVGSSKAHIIELYIELVDGVYTEAKQGRLHSEVLAGKNISNTNFYAPRSWCGMQAQRFGWQWPFPAEYLEAHR